LVGIGFNIIGVFFFGIGLGIAALLFILPRLLVMGTQLLV
jgi:hypothetical protein